MLGVNVGGVPLIDEPNGFLILSALLGGLVAVQLLLFRWLKWL